MGALRQLHDVDRRSPSPSAGWPSPGIPPLSGLLVQGRRAGQRRSPTTSRCGRSASVTAVLTAYYMSRLVVLAFGGEARFDKRRTARRAGAAHARTSRPGSCGSRWSSWPSSRSSPACSTCPGCTPTTSQSFLAPVFAGTLYNDHLSDGRRVGPGPRRHRGRRSSASSSPGWLWRGDEVDKPALEPAFLQRVWYWDDFYDTVIGRPEPAPGHVLRLGGRRPRSSTARSTARRSWPSATGSAARKLQTATSATTRSASPSGMAAIIAFMLSRTWWAMSAPASLTSPLLILLPAAGAAVLGLLGFDRRCTQGARRRRRLIASLVTLGFAIAHARRHEGARRRLPARLEPRLHGSTLGVRWYLGVDGISIFLVLLTAVLFPLAIVLGRNRENSRAYFAWMLLLEAACMGSFLSLDLHRVLLLLRADPGARRTSSSPAGATSGGPTPR